jgi:hypothetical protein
MASSWLARYGPTSPLKIGIFWYWESMHNQPASFWYLKNMSCSCF